MGLDASDDSRRIRYASFNARYSIQRPSSLIVQCDKRVQNAIEMIKGCEAKKHMAANGMSAFFALFS